MNNLLDSLFATKRGGEYAVSKAWEIASQSDHKEKSVSIMNFRTAG